MPKRDLYIKIHKCYNFVFSMCFEYIPSIVTEYIKKY